MKKAFLSSLLLMLLLTSTLNFAFVINSSFAEHCESNLQNDFLESINQAALSNETANSQSILEKNSQTIQKEALGLPEKTLR